MKILNALRGGGLIAASAIFGSCSLPDAEAPASSRMMAYVVCSAGRRNENRVYRVDLLAGKLRGRSDPLQRAGRPSGLAFDPVNSSLYLFGEAEIAAGDWPVTVLRVGGGEFELVNRLAPGTDYNRFEFGGRVMTFAQQNVDWILVSPDGKELYVSHRGLLGTAVWDADTGEELRFLSHHLDGNDFVSPDGKYIFDIDPGHDRKERKYGIVLTWKSQGQIRGFSTQTGELVESYCLKNNEGLQPPGTRIEEPFLGFIRSEEDKERLLCVYDRDTGEIMSQFDFRALTEMKLSQYPRELHGGRFLALSATKFTGPLANFRLPRGSVVRAGNQEGYVVLIDAMEQRTLTRTRVGTQCTNTVVAYE